MAKKFKVFHTKNLKILPFSFISMKIQEILKKNYDYILPLIIWILIFGKNIFSQMMFVDFVPDTYFTIPKLLVLGNYTSTLNPFDILRLIFTPLHLLPYLFQFSILIAMFLSYSYIRRLFKEKEIIFIILFALIYFFNPFVYSRIMIGQVGVLISYLLLPLNIFYIFKFFESNTKKSFLKMVLSITLTSLCSIHFFAINFIIFILSAIFLYSKNKFSVKNSLITLISFFLLIFLLNSFWIQGIFSNPILKTIDSSHEVFFAPKLSNEIPAVAKIMGMYGFWRESSYTSLYSSFNSGIYFLLLGILLILMLSGYYLCHEKKSKLFFSLFWIGLVLGTGISHPYTRPFFNSLFNYLPFFNGFRDSHKLVSLIALSYAYFIPILIVEIRNKIKPRLLKTLPLVLIILFILLFTFPLLGLNNQIKPLSYPSSYNQINSFLDSKQINGKIIYLPWQTYLTYNWTIGSSSDGRISTPINQLLKYPVLTGPDAYGAETIENHKITHCLSNKSISCLEQNSVQFLLLDKCSLYQEENTWITKNNQSLAYSSACIDVYQLNPTPQKQKSVPIRFIVGSIISILTLGFIIFFIIKK